jgi:hypothetical protein
MLPESPAFQGGVKGSDLKMGIFFAGEPRSSGQAGSTNSQKGRFCSRRLARLGRAQTAQGVSRPFLYLFFKKA